METVITEELNVINPGMIYNIEMAKLLHFCNWGQKRGGRKFTNTIYSTNLYQSYLKETVRETHLTEKQFYKQLDTVLATYSFHPVKTRLKKSRSYKGIKINSYKSL